MYEFYKKAVASFWTVEEVDLSQDYRDWDRLSGGCGGRGCRLPAGEQLQLWSEPILLQGPSGYADPTGTAGGLC